MPISIAGSFGDELGPAISGTVVVWQDRVKGSDDWDIMGMDLAKRDTLGSFFISATDGLEMLPAVSGRWVAWQHMNRGGMDWDVRVADISDPLRPQVSFLGSTASHELLPAISGVRVVWGVHSGQDPNLYIAGADLSDPNGPRYFFTLMTSSMRHLLRLSGDWLALLTREADGWVLADNLYDPFPPEVIVPGDQWPVASPAIDGHIVVWQDRRNGNWDIYGYNLATRTEFQVTDDPADQENPVVSVDADQGRVLVAWQDNRRGNPDIFGAVLDGPEVRGCVSPPRWDVNQDCRVDFEDLAILAGHWLEGEGIQGPGAIVIR